MNDAVARVQPLSPAMWGITAAEVQEQANKLDFNFAGVTREYYHPYHHPIADVWDTHQMHTLAFNKHQFDVLRYGMVLDEAAGLVLVSAPEELVDSGILVAQEYASLCRAPLADPEKPAHPLLAEYTLLVFRCDTSTPDSQSPTEVPAKPEMLFRLVFRNEAHGQDTQQLLDWSTFFPVFRLRAVYVSSGLVYAPMAELSRYRQSNPAYLSASDGTRVANPRVQEMLFRSPLLTLCDLWMKVLNAVVPPLPRKLRAVDLESDAINAFFSIHETLLNGVASTASTPGCDAGYRHNGEGYVPRRIALAYSANMDRMQRRVVVLPRTAALLRTWRDGELDIHYFRHRALQGRFLPSVEVEDTEAVRSPCVRMLLKPERQPVNDFDGREICAYLPPQSEYARPRAYRSEAAECVRLWVLKGLLLAELLHVHALFLDLDPVLVISQCTSLLWDGSAESGHVTPSDAVTHAEGRRRVLFYLCKVILETVEDFLQHSGIVWQVTVGVRDDVQLPDANLCAMCEEILTVVRVARLQDELSRQQAVAGGSASADASAHRGNRAAVVTVHSGARSSPSTYCTALVESLRASAERSGALTVHDSQQLRHRPVVPSTAFAALREAHARDLPASTVQSASLRRVFLFDCDMFPIFEALCNGYSDEVPVKTLVEVLQLKLDPQEANKYPALWPFEHPLVPLDHCGVPYNTEKLTALVSRFAMTVFSSASDARRGVEAAEPSLNYVEFSMLMLHLASR